MSEWPDSPENHRRFEELVPFFLNGTLGHEDRAFVEAFLQQHHAAKDSLSFNSHIRQTIQSLTPDTLPEQSRIDRLLDRWSKTLKNPSKHDLKASRYSGLPDAGQYAPARKISRLARWWSAVVDTGVSVVVSTGVVVFAAAVLLLNIHAMPQFQLHQDNWDGQPDIELLLAPGIKPDHETVVAQLERFNGMIVDQFLDDDRYRISVDLKNRAAYQHHLIDALQTSGHLDDYVLLANR